MVISKMLRLDEFQKQAVPVYLASEYWYCAAKIFHLIKLGEVSVSQKKIGKERHEMKAIEDLKLMKGIIVPLIPESIEHLKKLMTHQVSKAITQKDIITNSKGTILYFGILSELKCYGTPDAIDCTDGINPIIIERKFVKHIPTEPWLDHKVQVQIYMMTLQELGFHSVKSRIEYWSLDNNQRKKVFEQKLDDELKDKAIRAITETSKIVKGLNNPIPTKNPSKCKVCEYRVLCKWRADLKEYIPPYFLDIETNRQGTLIWCIGIFDSSDVKFSQFFLEKGTNKSLILDEAVQLLSQRSSSRILSFSGSAYESRILQKQLKAYKIDKVIARRIIDVHPFICQKLKKKSLGGLKTISTEFGYQFKHSDINGLKADLLYNDYQRSKNPMIKNKILDYNKDDVMALVYLAMSIPEAFDFRPFESIIKDEDRDLLRSYYEFSYLRTDYRDKGGLNVELRFHCHTQEEVFLLSKILNKYGFNPRVSIIGNTKAIRMYGYRQVFDFFSMLGYDLDKIISSRHKKPVSN